MIPINPFTRDIFSFKFINNKYTDPIVMIDSEQYP